MRGRSVFEGVKIDGVVHVKEALGFGVYLTACSREGE